MRHSGGRKQSKFGVPVSRRTFLQVAGHAVLGAGIGCVAPVFWLDDAIAAVPVSEGYLLVDTKKCQGCLSCMLACSLVHEGVENLSLARIQVLQDSFARFPMDLSVAQCRQCAEAPCVAACPVNALHVDEASHNIRLVDQAKCIGCKACLRACPHEPGRMLWNPERQKALKCDLCVDAPFWSETGGVSGKQACVEVCPLNAIRFTHLIPEQRGDTGYNVNLRGDDWKRLGYSTD
jgi:protein NrfC